MNILMHFVSISSKPNMMCETGFGCHSHHQLEKVQSLPFSKFKITSMFTFSTSSETYIKPLSKIVFTCMLTLFQKSFNPNCLARGLRLLLL